MIFPDNCKNCKYGYTVKCESGYEYIACDMQKCQEEKKERRCGMNEANETCWTTGHYTGYCDCLTCPHRYECSGSDFHDNDD